MPEKSRSGRSCKTHLFRLSTDFLFHKRETDFSPGVTKLGHDRGKCLSLRRKFVHFLLSQLCFETGRFCPAHATRTAQRTEQQLVFSTNYFFTFSGFASFSRSTLETAGTGTSHALLVLVVALFETKESTVFLHNREGFHDSSLSKAEVAGVGEVP